MRLVRLLTFAVVMAAHTARTAWAIRGVPEGPERWRRQARGQQRGAAACVRALGLRVRVEGEVPAHAALVAPNHFSLIDPYVFASVLPLAMTGREDVRRWPAVGWVARTMGLIGVDRARRVAATDDFVDALQDRLRAGVSVLVFPEGTVSHTGEVLPFKTGGFEAVAGTAHPVLPLYFQPVRARGRRVGADLSAFTWLPEPIHHSLWRLAGMMLAEAVVRVGPLVPAEGATRKTLAVETRAHVLALQAAVQAEGAGEAGRA